LASLSACGGRNRYSRSGSVDIRVQQLTRELDQTRQRAQTLEQQLSVHQKEVESLRAEIQQLRQNQGTSNGSSPPLPSDVSELRTQLTQERERRQMLEAELAKLKEETSVPAFGERRVRESDYLALKQELVELRRAAEEDRQERERIAAQLHALQAGQPTVAGDAPAESPAQRAQLDSLYREKDQIISSLRESLAASQQHSSELEATLANTKGGGSDGALRDENKTLRTKLDESRRHTEDLEAKLRVAARVSDLIFRMQAQQQHGGKSSRSKSHVAE
ncbi:MAG TPA: hypothetical protein VMT89_13465, partial [Candidatus Acidoferrales bacterium]|nr:hypothetical protein [Candidatus Acidoferrales bacterium]